MPILKEVLIRNSSLAELYLGWNKIGSKGGVEIAAGLSNSFVLKVRKKIHKNSNNNLFCFKN